jgi:hypothetical protein
VSPNNYTTDKLNRNEARKRVALVVSKYPNNIFFSSHALEELINDGLTTIDVLNILKSHQSRICKEGEFEKGSYRYRVETKNLVVVIAFHKAGNGITVVTAWDKRSK